MGRRSYAEISGQERDMLCYDNPAIEIMAAGPFEESAKNVDHGQNGDGRQAFMNNAMV